MRLARCLAAGVLAIAAGTAQASLVTCERTDTVDGGFTLTCKAQAVTPTPPVPPTPVEPPAPPPPPVTPPGPPETDVADACKPGESAFICWYRRSNAPPAAGSGPTAGGGAGADGFELSPGHPKVNVLSAGGSYAFTFQSTGAATTVGYGTAANTDSGMRVTSWITDAAGRVLVAPETRVVANWQPFPVQLPAGSYRLLVRPEAGGPLMVEQQ